MTRYKVELHRGRIVYEKQTVYVLMGDKFPPVPDDMPEGVSEAVSWAAEEAYEAYYTQLEEKAWELADTEGSDKWEEMESELNGYTEVANYTELAIEGTGALTTEVD